MNAARILCINGSGISGTARIVIRVVVPSAVSNRAVALCELANLIGPISAIAQRPVYENHGGSFPQINGVQSDAIADIDRSYRWLITVRKGDSMRRERR